MNETNTPDDSVASSTPVDGPVPPTRDREIEERLHGLAGRLCGVGEVLELIYQTQVLEPGSNHALFLVRTITDEAYIEIHELAGELHDLHKPH